MALTDTGTLQKVADPPAGGQTMNTKVSPKVERPERRIYTAEYKRRILRVAHEYRGQQKLHVLPLRELRSRHGIMPME